MRAVSVSNDAIGQAAAAQLANGGKRLRARLTLEAAREANSQGLGAKPEDVVWAAASVELIHQASLVHDDLMDDDAERRGAEAAWRAHGHNAAILLGDHFLAAAFDAAARAPGGAGLVRRLAEAVKGAIKGQSAELIDDRLPEADAVVTDYEARVREKSGRLMALPIEAGLMVGNAPETTLERASAAWTALGAAYQIGDDLAELHGRKAGRTRQSDLVQRRLSAPVAHYLATAGAPDREALFGFLGEPASDEGVAYWREQLLRSEVPRHCRAHQTRLIEQARTAGEDLPGSLRGLLETTIERITAPGDEPAEPHR